jgi:hypothetical protein
MIPFFDVFGDFQALYARLFLIQICSIGGDALLIPVEGILFASL